MIAGCRERGRQHRRRPEQRLAFEPGEARDEAVHVERSPAVQRDLVEPVAIGVKKALIVAGDGHRRLVLIRRRTAQIDERGTFVRLARVVEALAHDHVGEAVVD